MAPMAVTDARPRPLEACAQDLRVGGFTLRVADRGDAGVPLLLLMGIGGHLAMWRPVDARIADRRLIAFDSPGTGGSPPPRRPMRMRDHARLVCDLLDVLEVGQADVLGYSWGGALAQELARRAPERVRRLVLCATSPGLGGQPPRPLAATLLMTPARYYHPWLLRMSVPHIAGGVTRREPAALRDQAGQRLESRPSVRGYAHQLYAISGWSSLPWLHMITQRTLVVAGDDDPAVPIGNARWLASRIRGAQLHRVRGGGHLFLVDEPDNVVGHILGFLDRP